MGTSTTPRHFLRWAGCVVAVASSCALLGDTANAQETACLTTAARIVDAAAFPGLAATPPAAVYTTPRAFVTDGGRIRIGRINRQNIRMLRREGFVSGISQVYQASDTSPFGISTAIQLGAPGQAAADARRNRRFILHFKGVPTDWKPFAIPEVPGARGIRSREVRDGIANAHFSDGVYSYVVALVGLRVSDEVGLVRAAARSLYARVHGSTVCP